LTLELRYMKSPITWIRKQALLSLKKQLLDSQHEIDAAIAFVHAIEKGELDAGYHTDEGDAPASALAQSLVRMRDQMKKFAEEEQNRRWATEGLAQFMDILREQNNDLATLADRTIQLVVKYMHANQGALYLIQEDADEAYLTMESCVAYGRKKYFEQKFSLGTGLVGQAVLERSTLYLTEIPKNYIRITSGLGEALPTCILIVPLKTDDTVVGVIEIASFQKILPHEITFLEKVSESIAANIANLRAGERMRQLLQETQLQTEQMREQEEEMRQNMEELAATQEEMTRAQKQTEQLLAESQQHAEMLRAQEEELRQNLEEMAAQRELIEEQMRESERMRRELEVREEVFGHTTILSETDIYGTITHVNAKFCEVCGYSKEELMGKPQNIVRHPDMPKEVFRLMWKTIREGNVFHGIVKNRKKDGGHYWVDATIVPVRDENGVIVKYIGARYHITIDALAEQLYEAQMQRLAKLAAVTPL
jgi:PAS domain S-box-containing protein